MHLHVILFIKNIHDITTSNKSHKNLPPKDMLVLTTVTSVQQMQYKCNHLHGLI